MADEFTQLDPAVRAKAAKILRMLESDSAGERSNAATILNSMARAHGLTMIELAAVVAAYHESAPAPRPVDLSYPKKITLLFEAALLARANDNDRFNEWEYEFLSSLQDEVSRYGCRARLSPRQRSSTASIVRRCNERRNRLCCMHGGRRAGPSWRTKSAAFQRYRVALRHAWQPCHRSRERGLARPRDR
jgi:hypothetical protein